MPCLLSHSHRHTACKRWNEQRRSTDWGKTAWRAFLSAVQSSVMKTAGPSLPFPPKAPAGQMVCSSCNPSTMVRSCSFDVMMTPRGRPPEELCVNSRNTLLPWRSTLPARKQHNDNLINQSEIIPIAMQRQQTLMVNLPWSVVLETPHTRRALINHNYLRHQVQGIHSTCPPWPLTLVTGTLIPHSVGSNSVSATEQLRCWNGVVVSVNARSRYKLQWTNTISSQHHFN